MLTWLLAAALAAEPDALDRELDSLALPAGVAPAPPPPDPRGRPIVTVGVDAALPGWVELTFAANRPFTSLSVSIDGRALEMSRACRPHDPYTVLCRLDGLERLPGRIQATEGGYGFDAELPPIAVTVVPLDPLTEGVAGPKRFELRPGAPTVDAWFLRVETLPDADGEYAQWDEPQLVQTGGVGAVLMPAGARTVKASGWAAVPFTSCGFDSCGLAAVDFEVELRSALRPGGPTELPGWVNDAVTSGPGDCIFGGAGVGASSSGGRCAAAP